MQYQAIISYGYAQTYFEQGLYPTLDAALNAVSLGLALPGLAVSLIIILFKVKQRVQTLKP